jgi:hypothetical protein
MRIVYDDLAEFVAIRLRCEYTRKVSKCEFCPFYDSCLIDDDERLHVMRCEIENGGESE